MNRPPSGLYLSMVNRLLFFLMLCFPAGLYAQTSITGKVYDLDNRKITLPNVHVKNLTTNGVTYTNTSGEFKLAAKLGDLLEFSLAGYHTDTAYLINLSPRTVYLPVNTTKLNEVEIVGAKVNSGFYTPDKDIKPVTRFETDGLRGKANNDRAGGLKFNLGYGKFREAQAKREGMANNLKFEAQIKEIFTEEYVTKLTRLKGLELENFMSMFRPDVSLVAAEETFDYKTYTLKAYARWLKLSPLERSVPALPRLKRINK